MPQMPSRQSESKAIGILALHDQRLVDDVEHLEERHVGRDVAGDVVDEPARLIRARLTPDFQVDAHSMQLLLVAPLRRLHVLERQRLLVQTGWLADALELPRRHVREMLVVSLRLAVGRLALLAEVPAARLGPVQRVDGEQFREFQVVGDASGVLEVLVQRAVRSRHRDVVPELVAQLRDARERFPQARLVPRHPDVVPEDVPSSRCS